MNEILLSDWTLGAFKQREEERRKRERDEAALTPPKEEMQRDNESLRSEWTIAALQKRFAAMEQRLAALEQREEEQRRKERAEAALAPPREEKRRGEEAFLGSSTLVAPKQSEEQRRTKAQPEFADAKIEHEQLGAARPANEQRLQPQEAIRNSETARVGAAYKLARGFFSLVITASVAAAIGFGAAIYIVPIEKTAHFRALVMRGLDSIHGD